MNPGEAERMLKTLKAELAEAEQRAATVRKLVEGFQDYLRLWGKTDSNPEPAPPSQPESGNYPRGKEAVVAVLRDRAGEWFKLQDILGELGRRGWHPESKDPDNQEDAVRAAAKRAVDDEEIERIRLDGRAFLYRFPVREQSASSNGSVDQSSIEVDST